MSFIKQGLKELKNYPSAIAGLVIVVILIGIAIYAPIAVPYNQAIALWRGTGDVWADYPRNARPKWINYLPGYNLPETIIMNSMEEPETKAKRPLNGREEVKITFEFDFPYDSFPKEMNLFFNAEYEERRPYAVIYWETPDGRRIDLKNTMVPSTFTYRISQDSDLRRQLGMTYPHIGLFQDPDDEDIPLKGTYRLVIEGMTFEEQSELDAKMVVYGEVHGWGGTDHRRRDLMLCILWGTPVVLSFSFLAAVGSSLTSLVLAATGVWFGKKLDPIIQRITEVRLILPELPILMMIGTFYSRSIWVMLGVIVLINIFGAGIKSYRAMFLQIKESSYIEAAKAYGASDRRIIFRYMIPKIIPVLVPGFVTLIPSFVFLEATLAMLGLGDPVLPTWGKVLNAAYEHGALYMGHYYWVLQPAVLLMITGLGFAMVGFALDRIFNPRLRGF